MEIIFLGTGTSIGVPVIGCPCEVCNSQDPHDKRLRASIAVETRRKRLLIDCGPDFRWQMLTSRIHELDGVLLTHEHYDHVGGLDDLRPFGWQRDVDIYAEANVTKAIHTRLPYVFKENKYPGVPNLLLHVIDNQPFEVAGIPIIPIRLMHANLPILGFRIGNMAYLTDVKTIPEEEFSKLNNLEILIIDALRKTPHISHASLDEALAYIDRIQPKEAYLTHMSHHVGLHAIIDKELPPHIHYAYDGLRLHLNDCIRSK